VTRDRFRAITDKYASLRIAVVGDFCLDRYLEIDPGRNETSIETGLPVYNVIRVRAQPGGAGTILNNLSALGLAKVIPVGFAGEDGEGYELIRALKQRKGVSTECFLQTAERKTFTYCKPLIVEPGKPPRELNRLDQKNWSATPPAISTLLVAAVRDIASQVDAMVLLGQVDEPGTGVLRTEVLETVRALVAQNPRLPIVADSRLGLKGFPPVCFKMNADELARWVGNDGKHTFEQLEAAALQLAKEHGNRVVVSASEGGIVGAEAGKIEHAPALPVRGPIDVVGAGDAVTANLTAAFAAGGTMREALELSMAGASVVLHQLGTTGTASVSQLAEVMFG
jgi:rfaE bifunctional protein kinase chain/domain